MEENNSFTLINPQTGNLAFKLQFFENENPFDTIQRLNHYSIIWIKDGTGHVHADFLNYTIASDTLYSFSLYQPYQFNSETNLSGVALYFHPDFFVFINITKKWHAMAFYLTTFTIHRP